MRRLLHRRRRRERLLPPPRRRAAPPPPPATPTARPTAELGRRRRRTVARASMVSASGAAGRPSDAATAKAATVARQRRLQRQPADAQPLCGPPGAAPQSSPSRAPPRCARFGGGARRARRRRARQRRLRRRRRRLVAVRLDRRQRGAPRFVAHQRQRQRLDAQRPRSAACQRRASAPSSHLEPVGAHKLGRLGAQRRRRRHTSDSTRSPEKNPTCVAVRRRRARWAACAIACSRRLSHGRFQRAHDHHERDQRHQRHQRQRPAPAAASAATAGHYLQRPTADRWREQIALAVSTLSSCGAGPARRAHALAAFGSVPLSKPPTSPAGCRRRAWACRCRRSAEVRAERRVVVQSSDEVQRLVQIRLAAAPRT